MWIFHTHYSDSWYLKTHIPDKATQILFSEKKEKKSIAIILTAFSGLHNYNT